MFFAFFSEIFSIDNAIFATLGVTSLVAVMFVIERFQALRTSRVIPRQVADAVEQFREREDLPHFKQTCHNRPSPISRLLLQALANMDWPQAENVEALQTKARKEVHELERGLVALEVCIGIAPLLGLVGTIFGMITLFGSLGEAGLGDYASFASGISLALRATLIGLIIAIFSLVWWSHYTRKVESLTVEMETLCDEFLRRCYRLKRKAAQTTKAQQSAQRSRPAASVSKPVAESSPAPGMSHPAANPNA